MKAEVPIGKRMKGVVEEGGAITIDLILVIAAIAIFVIVILPWVLKLVLK